MDESDVDKRLITGGVGGGGGLWSNRVGGPIHKGRFVNRMRKII